MWFSRVIIGIYLGCVLLVGCSDYSEIMDKTKSFNKLDDARQMKLIEVNVLSIDNNLEKNFLNFTENEPSLKVSKYNVLDKALILEREYIANGLSASSGVYLEPISNRVGKTLIYPNIKVDIPFLNSKQKKNNIKKASLDLQNSLNEHNISMNDAYYLMIKEALAITETKQKSEILTKTKKNQDEIHSDAKLKFNLNRLSKYDLNIIEEAQILVQMQYQKSQADLLGLKDKFVEKYQYLTPVTFTFLSDEIIKNMEISLINNFQIKAKSIEEDQQKLILEKHKLEKTFRPNLSLEASVPIGSGGVEATQYSAKINISDFTWREGQYNTAESSLIISIRKKQQELFQLKNDLNRQLRENLTLLNQLIDQVMLQEQYEELLIEKRSNVLELFAAGRLEAEQVTKINMELFNFRLERLENSKRIAVTKLELLKLQGLLTVKYLGLIKTDE